MCVIKKIKVWEYGRVFAWHVWRSGFESWYYLIHWTPFRVIPETADGIAPELLECALINKLKK